MCMNLLIVEDEPSQIRTYKRAIHNWNNDNSDVKINFDFADDVQSVISLVLANHYDSAIVDLSLKGDTGDQYSGNKVIRIIRENLRYPVYVVSGSPSDIEDEFSEHSFIDAYERGIKIKDELLPKIVTRFKTGVVNVISGKGLMENALNQVFYKHLPDAIEHWESSSLPSSVKEKQILRYVLSHVQDILDIDEVGKDDKRSQAEVYIMPPVRKNIVPGLIIRHKNSDELYMVMTPACTISQDTADFYQMVKLVKLKDHPKVAKKKTSSDGRISVILNIVKDNNQRYHFLPDFKDMEAHILDFQQVSSIDKASFDDKSYNHIGVVTPAFYKDIVVRFTSFYSRLGSPDFEFEQMSKELDKSMGDL